MKYSDFEIQVGDLQEYIHPIGRPIKIANSINDETGVPIKELV